MGKEKINIFKNINIKDLIFTFLSIMGSIASITSIVLYILDKNDKFTASTSILFILYTLIIIGLFSWCFYLYRLNLGLNNKNRIQKEVHNHIHEISHQIRNTLDKENRDDFGNTVIVCLNYICNTTKKIFDKITDSGTSVCIKVIIDDKENNSDGKIKTIARDDESKTKRDLYSQNNTTNTIVNNTDFKMIYTEDTQCFISPNLLELKEKGLYRNETPDFHNFYISTIVVPIRIQKYSENGYTVVGFLCVDTLKKDTFNYSNKDNFLSVLGIIADSIFSIIVRLKKIELR